MATHLLIQKLLYEVEEYEGPKGIASVARDGYQGDLPEATMARLAEDFGSPGEALGAIQREAQMRVSANPELFR